MKKNKNRGFSAFEILVVILIYAVVFSTIAIFTLNSTKKTTFKSLKYDAIAFASNVRTYLINNDLEIDGKIYLKDIIEYDESYNIVSPFDSNNKCNPIDSYVKTVNNEALVTLKCDNYLLLDYNLNKDNVNIYYVGDWKESKPVSEKNSEKVVLYNYKKNNKYVFSQFLPLDMFLKAYKKNENVEVKTLNDIDNYEKKTLYRYIKTVGA